MTLRPWRHDAPLFLRIFAWMLSGVAAIQLLSTMLVFLLPPPDPVVFTIDQVTAALRSAADRTGALRLTNGAPDRANSIETPRTRGLRAEIARRLGVPVARVELHREAPPGFPLLRAVGADGMPPMMPRPGPDQGAGPDGPRPGTRGAGAQGGTSTGLPGPGSPPFFNDARSELLFGNFTVSLRLADGSWRTVRPARAGGMGFWRWRALLWLLATTMAMAPIAWILSRRIARPIAIFARAADRLGRDPRAAPLPVEGPPEIAEAAAAFNQMQARLSRYVEDRSMLTAAIAHDLRTPLMRLSLRLENAPEPLRSATETDIRDMEAMISAVLGFLRDLSSPLKRHPLDLRSLAESVTDGFADRGDPVVLLPGDTLVIDGDSQGLKAVISNLVGNAVAYGGSAQVEIGRNADEAWVIVSDHGPGIQPEMLDRVFEPFFRLEQSRNRSTGGVGLGLASARAVVRAHGGDIVLANHAGGGLVAHVTLPT